LEKILLFFFGLVVSGIAWHALHEDHEVVAKVLAGILLAITILFFATSKPGTDKRRSLSRK
jgi:hypothetical protein